MRTRRRLFLVFTLLLSWLPIGREIIAGASWGPLPSARQDTTPAPAPVALPNREESLKFAAFGDFGTGDLPQYQTAEQLMKVHDRFPFELVILLGDNLYGAERPQDFQKKFEIPYKPLLDAGVKFYAALGNHDAREQKNYKLFNMNGKLYYTFKAPKQNVRFFVLESTYMDPGQVNWIENELQTSRDDWKIVYLHHPLYSSGDAHGSDLALRATLEPMFVKHGVSVVLAGHDHVYERVKPQKDIPYFVVGSGGELRRGDLKKTALTDVGFDTDNVFLVAEILDQTMYFNAISRTGQIVDSGMIVRRTEMKQPPAEQWDVR
jgi:3',5'-cyclic AMP phosphodiesterase CpdA